MTPWFLSQVPTRIYHSDIYTCEERGDSPLRIFLSHDNT
ncbi:unnamed protein product [Larinioides sclopetarius]|uniref:Uncharacterized protein n=1 Tax=Larinioides sclopetarius TaxID=280406 RepID=A0AAV1Z8H1_9ARAC